MYLPAYWAGDEELEDTGRQPSPNVYLLPPASAPEGLLALAKYPKPPICLLFRLYMLACFLSHGLGLAQATHEIHSVAQASL